MNASPGWSGWSRTASPMMGEASVDGPLDPSHQSVEQVNRTTPHDPSSRVLRNPRKSRALSRLGRTERIILSYLASSNLAKQFRIADIVYGTSLSTKVVYEALHRLQERGFVFKRGRGLYSLSDWVDSLLLNGFTVPGNVEPVDKPVDNLGGHRLADGRADSRSELSRSGLASHSSPTPPPNSPVSSSSSVSSSSVASPNSSPNSSSSSSSFGWGVLRFHFLLPKDNNNWLAFFVSLYLVKLLVDFSFSLVRSRLERVYGPWRLRLLASSVRSLFRDLTYYSPSLILGCHGRYNGSPGSFSPLLDCASESHSYERGLDLIVPGWLAEAVDDVLSIFKVYSKTPSQIKDGNPSYYDSLLQQFNPPPSPPESFSLVFSHLRSIRLKARVGSR